VDMNKYLQQVQDPNVVTCFKILFEILADKQDQLDEVLQNHQETLHRIIEVTYKLSDLIQDTTKLEKEVHDIRSTEYYD
jgi:K+/H+ antiporter YhaU regulatory subunit KhtT